MSPFKYYIGHFDPIVFFCVLNYIQHGLRYDKLFPYIKMWYAVVKTDFCRTRDTTIWQFILKIIFLFLGHKR